jgi:hypothetical protein
MVQILFLQQIWVCILWVCWKHLFFNVAQYFGLFTSLINASWFSCVPLAVTFKNATFDPPIHIYKKGKVVPLQA